MRRVSPSYGARAHKTDATICGLHAIYSLGPKPGSAERAEQLARLWRDVHLEDQAVCERLQQGRVSDAAAGGGVLSPVWEDSVRSFQELVVNRLR